MRYRLLLIRIAFLLFVFGAYELIVLCFPDLLPPPTHIRAVRRSDMDADDLAESLKQYD